MAIRKFKVEVVRTDVYEVEIDDTIFTEEFRKEWAKSFTCLDELEDVAKLICIKQMRDPNEHKEGFGYVNVDGELPWHLKNKTATKGLNIIELEVDENYTTEAKEIK